MSGFSIAHSPTPRRKTIGRSPRVTPDLVQWLQDTFPKRCIQENEDPVKAHRYAAKVELADQIIQMAKASSDRDAYSYEED